MRRWLVSAGDPVVAVRSSASNEDTGLASAAGQHDSFLGVHGIDAVVDAVRACRASLWSERATAYRKDSPTPAMAVIIQHHVDAAVSGVLFTSPDGSTLIEASWGLGPSVVEGHVTPDRYEVRNAGVTRTIADKPTALVRDGSHLVTRPVPADQRRTPTLSDATAVHLATLAHRAATTFGSPQDIEWAIAANTIWLLQSRPVTTHPPTPTPTPPSTRAVLSGTPASHGVATGSARVVRGPADFGFVRPGDILVCPYTDPAWTPLLSIAAGVITETGGVLSHAAIVAREHGIPAVLAVPRATDRIPTGVTITLNGSTGAVHLNPASET
ncbi:pyruvate,water dikinase [Kribbella aluminosa]|uniref:Pyruvate,water dikinase n=1 Tax=Kribbella aluminosa TaxID=416017 RepID=A0ABS4UVL8_9ACTN|nr:PEP/pyruvate-binding domain-containing protein [Kribbella aluminosa]MBP2355665.1 pyruvate,water dikinase [Kribbella aluminosa]